MAVLTSMVAGAMVFSSFAAPKQEKGMFSSSIKRRVAPPFVYSGKLLSMVFLRFPTYHTLVINFLHL